MTDRNGKFADLDLEKIALEAIEESFEEEAPGSDVLDASLTIPQPDLNVDSSASTIEPPMRTGAQKSLPSNWASMDAVARLRGATDQIVKEHLEKEKKPDQAARPEESRPEKPLFALEKKERVPGSPLRKLPVVVTEKREVTRIAKVALSCTAEATMNKADDGAAVGRRFSRHGGTEKTVVFKASQTAGFINQQRARAVKLKDTEASKTMQMPQGTQEAAESDIEEFQDVTEKAIPFNVVPLTDVASPDSFVEKVPFGLPPSQPVLLGTVVVEAPKNAEVFMNGQSQGEGRVVLSGLDRFTPFWVRVHLKDHDPWSSQISLQGQKAAKVQPDLY